MSAPGGPSNLNRYPAKDDEFVRHQILQQDQFDYYRTFGVGRRGWDRGRREGKIARRAQPVRAAPIDLHKYFVSLTRTTKATTLQAWRIAQNRTRMTAAGRESISADGREFTRDALNDRTVRTLLALTGLRFVRVLGWVCTIS